MEEDNDPKGKRIREEVRDEGDAEEARRVRICYTAYTFVNNRVEVGDSSKHMPLSVGERRPESLDDDWHSHGRLSSLKVPNKYKQFCKLACDDWLPVRAAVVDAIEDWTYSVNCSRCGEVESTMHCLKECSHASAVWSMSRLSLSVVHLSALTFREFFRDVTRVLDDDRDLSLFVLICWSLWEARNEHEEQHITRDPADTLDKALLLLEQTTTLWERDKLLISTNAELAWSRPRTWSPPPRGWLKLNVEAINLKHMMAMGAVFREDKGHVLAAISARYDPEKDLLTAKAVALERALSIAENGIIMLGQQKVLVELTSNLIVECLAEFEEVRSELCNELHHSLEISLSVASRFSEIEFAKVSARENRLAYCLASKALLLEWEESPGFTSDAPDWLKEAIAADLPD